MHVPHSIYRRAFAPVTKTRLYNYTLNFIKINVQIWGTLNNG